MFDLSSEIARQLREGATIELGPLDRLKKAFGRYDTDPVGFVRDVLRPSKGIFDKQRQALEQLAEDRHVSVRSGHGPGKTATASWAVLWFLATKIPAKVPCTAPSESQLLAALWPEISKWLKPSRLADHFEWTATRVSLKAMPEAHFAIARSAKKGESLAGFQADYLLYVIDEASGVEENIMEVVDGALSGENRYVLMISNPTRTSGRFYNSHHKDRNLWQAIHIKYGDSPLVSPEFESRMAAQWGRDSNIYRVRVLGEFPTGSQDTFIPLDIAEAARFLAKEDNDKISCVMGIDPAELGQDLTAFVIRRGEVVLEAWTRAKILQDEIVGEVAAARKKRPISDIKIDKTGYGSGPWQALMEAFHDIRIEGINFGERAYNAEEYATRGEELWGGIRNRMQAGRLDLSQVPRETAEEIVAQLTTRKFRLSGPKGQLKLEPKDAMRSRGIRSPDLADALALAFIESNAFNTVWAGGERLTVAEHNEWAASEERVTAHMDW